jgi:EmrB/QacA subfamily drug resistance transporter
LAALAVVILLGALDQTIVATAMPRIIEDLQGLSMYAWVTTSYLLTSTVTVPIYGKLGDQYGRKPILMIGVALFLLGSFLSGLAGEFGPLPMLGGGMTQLVAFRAVQGLGAGALMTTAFAMVGDLYSPRERGRLFGVFGGVFGLATVAGPFIGGFFTDHGAVTLFGHRIAGWRWVFYVNLPLGLLALFMIVHRIPNLGGRASARVGAGAEERAALANPAAVPRVDYLGAALVVLTAAPLLIALTLGGASYRWDSPRIIALLAASGAAFILFLRVEARTPDAILPLRLFRIHTFRLAALAAFVMSMAFLGVVMFMPLYMQVVQGLSATQSGVALLPLIGAMVVSSVGSGRLVSRIGRYKPFMVGGGVLLILGVISLTGVGPETTSGDLAWRLALTGIGLGPAQTLFSLVIQNAAPAPDIGVATGMSQFSRQMGSTVGVALFGTFLVHGLTLELPKHVPLLPGATATHIDLSDAQRQAMRVDEIRSRVADLLDARYRVIERAYAGDASAVHEIVSDPRMPEQIKDALGDGGVPGRVHRQIEERAALIERELRAGPEGRDRLLYDPQLTPALRRQLANIPTRAFEDPQLIERTAALFRDALLAKESDIASAALQHSLLTARAAMSQYGDRLVEQIHTGMKTAFATAIVHMFERAMWIVIVAVLIVLFIPELPLRTRAGAATA